MEKEIVFSRFSDSKQEQVRQFVAYAQLMGLDGKDLVSIGNKLDRINKKAELARRLEIVKTYEVFPIGEDKNMDKRFKIKVNDVWYHVKTDWSGAAVKNCQTNKTNHVALSWNDWGRGWRKDRERYQFLWELYEGIITLP